MKRWNMTQNNFKILKNLKNFEGTKNVRNLHILRPFSIFESFFFIFYNFIKEPELHIVSIDDDNVEYSPIYI